ncbi:hypothetical protein KY340_00475 [Candidatus Woesearchaeota archaeon]|nr:hypothetical protein [Candidatus Woesearchaeota archaeon]
MIEKFKKLEFAPSKDYPRRGRGLDWHYATNENLYSAPKEGSRIPIPGGLFRKLFPGFKAVCAIYVGDKAQSLHKLCAIPENGGPYVILEDFFPESELQKLRTEKGLQNILFSIHFRHGDGLLADEPDLDELRKLGLEIAKRPDGECDFCGKNDLDEALLDTESGLLYCNSACFYNRECD